MNNLLGRSLMEYLHEPYMIVGLVLLSFGIATVALARRITRVARQRNDIENSDAIFCMIRIIGILLMVAGFVICGLDVIYYVRSR